MPANLHTTHRLRVRLVCVVPAGAGLYLYRTDRNASDLFHMFVPNMQLRYPMPELQYPTAPTSALPTQYVKDSPNSHLFFEAPVHAHLIAPATLPYTTAI